MKKVSYLLFITLVVLLCIEPAIAQTPDIASPVREFISNTLRPLYAPVLVIVALVGSLFGIGDVWGDNRDWKKFFTKLGMFVGAAIVAVVVIEFVNGLQPNV